jgi:DNA repair protein RadC
MNIKQLSKNDRPRERMLTHGPEALSNAELLAIILLKGFGKTNVLDMCQQLLSKYPIHKLQDSSFNELKVIPGIGTVKALQIKAVFEFSKRHRTSISIDKRIIKSPKEVYDFFVEDLIDKKKEHFMILMLDSNNQIIGKDLVSIGTINASIVHPREVFRNAIKEGASSIIAIHNHPSGNTEPSEEDIEITERLKEAGNLVGIKLLDHVIIGNDKFRSI